MDSEEVEEKTESIIYCNCCDGGIHQGSLFEDLSKKKGLTLRS